MAEVVANGGQVVACTIAKVVDGGGWARVVAE